jgi:hypothetical protein
MKIRNIFAVATFAALSASSAFADPVTWAVLPTTVSPTAGVETGSIGSVNVTYTGEIQFVDTPGSFNYFLPLSTYVGGVAGNAPTDGGMIAIDGNPGVTDTFTFSAPVSGLVFSVVSLGQGGVPTTYDFNDSFSIVACGAGAVYGGGCVTESGNNLIGNEGDGTIVFAGSLTSLSFTASNPEYWNGFTIGLLPTTTTLSGGAVPEPGTLAMVGTGLLSLAGAVRRKFAR